MNLRTDLPALTPRIANLPLSERGYPIPYFVGTNSTGARDFRIMDPVKYQLCLRKKRCWICGEDLGKTLAFLAGPMCGINRTSSEPPSHEGCACWAVRACPFLVKPQMVRREDEETAKGVSVGGNAIKRNPGVAMVWVCADFETFGDGKGGQGGQLIQIGDPYRVRWFKEAREATRAEVQESIRTGLPFLMEAAQAESPEAVSDLNKKVAEFEQYLPAL